MKLSDIFLVITLEKVYLGFLSNWKEYDCGDGFPFEYELNRFPFGSKSKGNSLFPLHSFQFARHHNFQMKKAMNKNFFSRENIILVQRIFSCIFHRSKLTPDYISIATKNKGFNETRDNKFKEPLIKFFYL